MIKAVRRAEQTVPKMQRHLREPDTRSGWVPMEILSVSECLLIYGPSNSVLLQPPPCDRHNSRCATITRHSAHTPCYVQNTGDTWRPEHLLQQREHSILCETEITWTGNSQVIEHSLPQSEYPILISAKRVFDGPVHWCWMMCTSGTSLPLGNWILALSFTGSKWTSWRCVQCWVISGVGIASLSLVTIVVKHWPLTICCWSVHCYRDVMMNTTQSTRWMLSSRQFLRLAQ